MTQKKRKVKKFHVLKCGMFDLESEGFSCSLDVLHGGLGEKIARIFFQLQFFFLTILFYQKPGFGSALT
jgi:hypothetical protein